MMARSARSCGAASLTAQKKCRWGHALDAQLLRFESGIYVMDGPHRHPCKREAARSKLLNASGSISVVDDLVAYNVIKRL